MSTWMTYLQARQKKITRSNNLCTIRWGGVLRGTRNSVMDIYHTNTAVLRSTVVPLHPGLARGEYTLMSPREENRKKNIENRSHTYLPVSSSSHAPLQVTTYQVLFAAIVCCEYRRWASLNLAVNKVRLKVSPTQESRPNLRWVD